MRRAQRPIPKEASALLRGSVPASFKDDGCTNSPDSIFGFDFKWACRIHDWRYCTRCHDPGSMTYETKLRADMELKRHFKSSLPLRWRWIRYVYYAGVLAGGGFNAFDSCGPEEGETCRHDVTSPQWMS